MLAQTCHALSEFEHHFGKQYKEWYNDSNYIVCLEIENEEKLNALLNKAKELDIKVAPFYEPDLDNQLTAVTFEPGDSSKRLLRKLPLALRGLN